MLYTILQIVVFQALFLLVYDFFLRRETFFNYNRVYLLATSVLALVLPFLKFPELKKMTKEDVVIQLPEIFIGTPLPSEQEIFVAEQAGIIIEQPQTPHWHLIALIGITLASLIFVSKLIRLYWLRHSNPKRWKGNVLIVKLIKSSAAFSFFNTIFLGEEIPDTDKPTIYKHELVHIKEWHTLDLLFFEILRIAFWFNPLVYIYQNRIKELHEFIADAKAVKQNGKTEFYQSLLNQVFDVQNVSFTNTFFRPSLIKKRIVMLQKSRSKQMNLIKYTLLIPLVFGMLIYTSLEVRAQEKPEIFNETVSQEMTDEELIEEYYQEILKMKKNGSTFFEIAEYAGFKKDTPDRYIMPREEFLKSKAYLRYIAESSMERKSKEGTLTMQDIDRFEELKSVGHKTYADFREWKKSEEAKSLWESYAKDGELRLVVNDLDNKTKEEQKRFDALLNQLGDDEKFNKLTVCETKGGSIIVLTDPKPNSESPSKTIGAVEENIEVPFSVIEEVPTTIKCKDLPTNTERKACMSDFVQKHVNKNFNKSIADSLDLSGKQRIFVSFKIGKDGKIKDARARAAHEALEDEAIRVIKSLPQFVPGRQKGKLVVVPYALPIVFQTSKTPVFNKFKDSLTNNATKLKDLFEMRDRLLKNSTDKNPVVVQLNKQIDSISNRLTTSEREKLFLNLLIEREKNEIRKAIEKERIPFSVVEIAPIHPDCKTIADNEERKKCTSQAVSKYVNQNFNIKMAENLDLVDDVQRISVAFIIDKQGFVKNVKARAKHEKLKEEAIRIMRLLPQFIPGEHEGKKVDVPYSLPIMFKVVKDKKKKD